MYFKRTCLVYFLKMSRVKTRMKKLLIFYSNLSHISVCLNDIFSSSDLVSIVIEDTASAKARSESYFFLSSDIFIQPSSWAFSLVPILICPRSLERYILGSLITCCRYYVTSRIRIQHLQHSQSGDGGGLPWARSVARGRVHSFSWSQDEGEFALDERTVTVIKILRNFATSSLLDLRELILSFPVELGVAPILSGGVDVKVHNLKMRLIIISSNYVYIKSSSWHWNQNDQKPKIVQNDSSLY